MFEEFSALIGCSLKQRLDRCNVGERAASCFDNEGDELFGRKVAPRLPRYVRPRLFPDPAGLPALRCSEGSDRDNAEEKEKPQGLKQKLSHSRSSSASF